MRLLIYNIAYGTGSPGAFYERLWTVHRYLRTSRSHLDHIIRFIERSEADIVGLVEVDTGSYRTRYLNQVEAVAFHLKNYHCSNKYGERSIGRKIPFLRDQANAILTKDTIRDSAFHYFPVGFKRLILEVEVRGLKVFLVHLALNKRIRKKQLVYLSRLVNADGPVMIAGDFNTFTGPDELLELRERLDLVNPNQNHKPTYPSWNPKRQLDFVLCSKNIHINNFSVEPVRFSDHLPIILDFDV